MSYIERIKTAQIEAGEAALKYCIDNKLAGWYVVTRVKSGRGLNSKCLVSGPYTAIEDATAECIHDSYFVEYMTTEEAARITY